MTTKAKPHEWMTREQIDSVIDQMSAADLIEGAADDPGVSNAQRAGRAFDAAAARLGVSNGQKATASIRASDFLYLAEAMGGVMGDGPKSESTGDSPPSAGSGE